jgi:O-acetyl-ADP-ribose deacetylase (regulator of RNase III)
MIKIIKKDVTTVTSGVVAHGANAVSVMGSGVALAIAGKWPKVFEQYKIYLATYGKDFHKALGNTQLVILDDNLWVVNCITQVYTGFDKFGNPPASLDAIERSLRETIIHCNTLNLDLYTPQIGCGLGGLDWETQVKPIYEKLSEELSDGLNWYVCTI